MSDHLTEEQEASLQSMITTAMASTIKVEGLQLPWEEPVFKAIFSSGEAPVPDAVMPVFYDQPFCHQHLSELKQVPSSSAGSRGPNLKVCVYGGLPTTKLPLNEEERWTLAVKGWLQIIVKGSAGTDTGDLLDASCDDLPACIGIVSEILGGKSINTVEKRLRQMSSFVAWCAKSGHEPFPVTMHLFRAFFKHMVKEKARPSAFKGAIEVMNFSKHVLGLCIEDGVGSSPWVRGILRKAKQDKPMTSRARALLCLEVLALERTLLDEEAHAYDQFASGVFTFAALARARLGDLQSVSDFVLDVINVEGEGPKGYIELTSWSHKLRRMCPALPLIAPVRGVGVCPWVTAWVKAATDAGLPFDRFTGGHRLPLLPALRGGEWTDQPISTAVATRWLQGILERSQVSASAVKPTGHSLKGTTLSWLAKFGTCRDHRLILGHHSETGMAEIYARDTQAAPLRSLVECLAAIRAGNFFPDLNRSGFFEKEISDMRKVHPLATGPHAPVETAAQSEISGEASSWDCIADKPPPVEGSLDTLRDNDDPHAEDGEDQVHDRPELSSSGSSTSTSESVTTSETSGAEADMAQQILPPVPEATWRVGCSTWQHRKTKTLHLLAAEGEGIFVCGRPRSGAHVEAEGRPTLISMRCSQCDKGKHIKSTAQLVHELDLKRQRRS